MTIRSTIESYFHHFNAGELSKMSASLVKHLESGGKLFITLAGAMSTAGIGKLLAPMIRRGYVAGISCTGANLEEDVFRMMAFPHYTSIENWRALSSQLDEILKTQTKKKAKVAKAEEPKQEEFKPKKTNQDNPTQIAIRTTHTTQTAQTNPTNSINKRDCPRIA